MPVLGRKVIRDLFRMKGQVLAISLVIASGVAPAASPCRQIPAG